MTRKAKITKTVVASAKPESEQYFIWDTQMQGFALSVNPGGSKSYAYQGRINGKAKIKSLGRVDKFHHPDIARDKAREIKAGFRKGVAPPKPVRRRLPGTLGDLLTAYCDYLDAGEKASAPKVRTEIKKDVETAHPKLWRTQANEITIDDCMRIVGDLHAAGTPRQADKIRSYMKSAYSQAINARFDVTAPKAMRDMRLTMNPAREVRKVQGSSNANDRILSLAEFRDYWKRIQALSEPHRSVAMLHVLAGGTRMKQLSRATLGDLDRDSMTLTLRDNKGRRSEPRVYQIPVRAEMLECVEQTTIGGDFIFSADGGRTPMGENFITSIAKDVCTAMDEAGELEGAPFTGKTIRATIETRLMDKPYNVSSDVLARWLSHGLGGVQAKHYARDPLLERQREALDKLWQLLHPSAETADNVVELASAS